MSYRGTSLPDLGPVGVMATTPFQGLWDAILLHTCHEGTVYTAAREFVSTAVFLRLRDYEVRDTEEIITFLVLYVLLSVDTFGPFQDHHAAPHEKRNIQLAGLTILLKRQDLTAQRSALMEHREIAMVFFGKAEK